MVKYVVQIGDEVLRQKCAEVKKFDSDLGRLMDDLRQTVRAETARVWRRRR